MNNYAAGFDRRVAATVARAAAKSPAFAARLKAAHLTANNLKTTADLSRLPVLRKDDVIELQRQNPPFGGLLMVEPGALRRIYQSPGPINEPEPNIDDYWRWKPALTALGVQPGDLVLNAFTYHLTPAGAMIEEAVHAIGAAVIPGGVGNKDTQIAMLAQFPVTTYVGTPSYLKALLEKAQTLGYDPRNFALRRAFVTAEPLPPSLRQVLQDYGLTVRQAYGTAETGLLGYECEAEDGWHVPDDALVQVCDPQSGQPLPPGQTGEVVVTLFNEYYALIRFGTGDLSTWHSEPCSCGRSTPRLVGWQGRSGEAVKVRGMFLHPRQAAALMAHYPAVQRYQFVITRDDHVDMLTCRVMLTPDAPDMTRTLTDAVREGLKFRAAIEIVDQIADNAPTLVDERDWNQ